MCSGAVYCVRSPSVYRRHLGTKRLLKSVEHGGDDKGAAVPEMSLLRMEFLLVPAPALEGPPPTPVMVVTRELWFPDRGRLNVFSLQGCILPPGQLPSWSWCRKGLEYSVPGLGWLSKGERGRAILSRHQS